MASVATPWDAEDIRMGTHCTGKSIYMGGYVQSYMTKLLPLQGAPLLSIFSPRVSLRFALGYVLTALSGHTSSALGVSELAKLKLHIQDTMLFFGEVEPVNIDITAELLGCIVEDGELGAHEVALIVEYHIYLASDACPVAAVETV